MLVLGCMRSASTSMTDFLLEMIFGSPEPMATGNRNLEHHPNRHFWKGIPKKIKGYEGYPSSTIGCVPKRCTNRMGVF